MTQKPKWTDRLHGPIRVLNHADGLRLEKFTDADLDQIADCDDVFEIDLRSNRAAQPVDLGGWRTYKATKPAPGAGVFCT